MIDPLLALTAYVDLLEEASLQRIRRVKAGVSARQLLEISASMEIPLERLLAWIGLSSAEAKRKLRVNAVLTLGDSERDLGIARLIGGVAKNVSQSDTPENFNAATWTARWLDRPNASLGGRTPGDFMDTADGRQLVESLVAIMQSGAYS